MDNTPTREFIRERDLTIFKMRSQGVSADEIAKRLSMDPKAVNTAIGRQLKRMNSEARMAYPEVLRLELERLDQLQAALWPQTQHRRIDLPDGTATVIEPDEAAVRTVLQIMDRRARLLGIEQQNINITVEQEQPQRVALAGAESSGPAAADAFDPETEARALLEIAAQSGVLPREMVEQILGEPLALEAGDDAVPVEAEIIDETIANS